MVTTRPISLHFTLHDNALSMPKSVQSSSLFTSSVDGSVQLGLMGVTVIYSSGDDGVAGFGGDCLLPDGTQTPAGKIFNPSFPSK